MELPNSHSGGSVYLVKLGRLRAGGGRSPKKLCVVAKNSLAVSYNSTENFCHEKLFGIFFKPKVQCLNSDLGKEKKDFLVIIN